MTVLNKTAQRVTAMSFIAVLVSSVGFGQVKTTVPDVVPGARPATVERITIHGKALEGNLEGDAVDRTVLVFLPPSYSSERSRRYPVVYALHGYSIGAEQWSQEIHVPQTIEGAFARGAKEMIVVLPDSKTVHNGSMYSSSATTGDFETFIALDVVSYIDAHYRTIPNRTSRGLVGHSMGGYGATRIGMKHPDVFGSLYIMSPCCLSARGAGATNPANERRWLPSRLPGLREAALRAARAAGFGGSVVAESEQSAALSRPADWAEPAVSARTVGGQRAARLHRSVHPEPATVPRDRHRRR
jgi:pimeloyl-ACP methyl ester carboxylesterase